ncbi:Peptidase family M50 [Planctomycetes bacterium Pan216]|uniref:Peptidase family M50 n=1 Tax=Kolteria novifilia TaxID=2527975 RepID=A0A518B6E0_9BACT|nr:Peptidase family M50 [Planctomycetes bacterium Pan216]
MTGFGAGHSGAGRWDRQSWSLVLGSIAGIRVRVQIVFILFALFWVLSGYQEGMLVTSLLQVGFLFGVVLLHEFGHCFACRSVGGRADDILMWPLGGLAYCEPPHRPGENLITTLGGPAVNVVIFILVLPILFVAGEVNGSLFNPFVMYVGDDLAIWSFALRVLFKVNYVLLLFNLLPIYPFDGGRVLQELIWFRTNYHTATVWATNIGMGGAVLLAGISLWNQELQLAAIAVFAFIVSYQTRREAEIMGQMPENEFGYDFSEGYTSLERSMGSSSHRPNVLKTLHGRWKAWSSRRQEEHHQKLRAELDRLLEKIHQHGMESLSRQERRILEQASKQLRSRK